MWSSELDVLFGTGEYSLDTSVLNGLTNTSLYNTNRQVLETGPVTLSPEFVNYILILIIYSLRYAAVYWYTNASFSVVFASLLLVGTLHNVFAYCGMGILYKFSVNLHAVGSVSLVLSNTALIVLYLLGCTVMFCSTLCIFNYGYCHYVECCRRFLKVHFPTYATYVAKMPVGCHGYIPHMFATISLVLFVALRAPVVYDYVSVYRVTALPILLTCIVMDACYMIVWIGLWFAFTIKQTWDFQINPQMDIVQQTQRNAMVTARNNGHIPQTDVTVVGPSTRTDISRQNTAENVSLNDTVSQNGYSHHHNGISNKSQKPQANGDISSSQSEEENISRHEIIENRNNQTGSQEIPKVSKSQKLGNKLPKIQIIRAANSSRESSDIVDSIGTPQSPISPTSALKKSGLRKSGERRHNAPQRVTFDDSVDQIVDDEVSNINSGKNNDPVQLSPKHNKKKSRGTKNRESDTGAPDGKNRTHSSDVTPDNTLTRNYRSSLRDKCGQYYSKQFSDLGIPPAAQSSPLPRERPLSDSYEPSANEILLNPLTAPGGSTSQSRTNSTLSPTKVGNDYFHQRVKSSETPTNIKEYSKGGEGDRRLRDPKRLSGRKFNDDSKAYSYPPQLSSPTTKEPSRQPLLTQSSGNQPFYAPTPAEINKPLKPTASYSNTSSHSPNSSSTNNTSYDSYYPNITKNYQPHIPHDSKSSVKVLPPHLIRPVSISTKPELNHRDSALPSSNETSSNESAEHILCSQV